MERNFIGQVGRPIGWWFGGWGCTRQLLGAFLCDTYIENVARSAFLAHLIKCAETLHEG